MNGHRMVMDQINGMQTAVSVSAVAGTVLGQFSFDGTLPAMVAPA
jgi:hypothetical protein